MDPHSSLVSKFAAKFGLQPEFIVRAPGRVNLIGEHIDYSGYGVLPMAIDYSVTAAVASNDSGKIVIANVQDKYRTHERPVDDLEINKDIPEWYNYFMCGYKGMTEHLVSKPSKGFYVLVDGRIPPSAGLSSSSALVCCAAICSLRVITGKTFQLLSRDKVAAVCASCEKYIGTEGGGMDQSICLLAEKGKASRIEFNPIRAKLVSLPEDLVFVVSHSGTQLNKAATGKFNQRVVECRLAAQVLAQKHGLDWMDIKTLGRLQKKVGKGLSAMVDVIKETIHREPYTLAEIAAILEANESQIKSVSLSANTQEMNLFALYDRAMHVFTEAKRVDDFQRTCTVAKKDASVCLGQLMNASHESCAKLYKCSCPELDELVKDCREAGAVGSRLTGAGWGGCVVSAVPKQIKAQFLEKLKSSFYSRSEERKTKFEDSVFLSEPAAGAEVIELNV